MSKLTEYKFTSSKIYWIIIAVSVLIGTIIRFKGLGTWTLALDEYYIIKSSENILKYGLPQFPNGGYYVRGILLQYMIAPLLSLGVSAELVGRLFTVIANLLTIPALYLISKKIGNKLIATIVIVIFSFSIWEIEFARFARMYAPFQAIFTWYIYFTLVDFKNKNFDNYKWLLILSAVSFLVYEGSIFLAVFNFIPFILNRKIKFNYLSGAIITFLASAYFNLFNFRTLFSQPILPPEYLETIKATLFSSPILLPKILLPFAFDTVTSIISTCGLMIINFYLIYKLIMSLSNRDFWSVLSILLLCLFAILNQFGLFLLSFLIVVFWNLVEINFNNRRIVYFLGTIFTLNLFYWFSFGLLSDSWYSLFNDFSSYSIWGISKRLLIGFFNFPDNYFSLLNYFRTLPFLIFTSGFFLIILFFSLLSNKNKNVNIKFLSGSLIFFVLLSTIPTLLYQETRYTFYLVSLLIILVVYSIHHLSNKHIKNKSFANSTFILITLLIFVLSHDFNIYHLINIDSEEVNYRMIYKNNYYKKHLYRRWDIKTPTEFVKNNLAEDDRIMINENSLEYYLPKVDYYSFDYGHRAFVALSVNQGEKERWSNAKLVYNNKSLIDLIENRSSTIWFVVYPENYLYEINFYKIYKDYMVYDGVDSMIKVFKFPQKNHINF